MADYWKSQPRKLCDFCKCWIADNKPSRDFHERGKRHQENVAKRIDELRKKGIQELKNEKDAAGWMVQMEREALKKLREDLTADPSLAALYGVKFKSQVEKEKPKQDPPASGDSQKSVDGAGDWQEALSPEGYVYYWNAKTGVSAWELPNSESTSENRNDVKPAETSEPGLPSSVDGDIKEDQPKCTGSQNVDKTNDKDKTNDGDLLDTQPSMSVWKQLQSPEGYPYYWNTLTGEVSWEVPSSNKNIDIKSESAKEQEGNPKIADIPLPTSSVKNEDAETAASDPKSLVDENSKSTVPDTLPSRKRTVHSAYGEWQELREESEPMVDLELPVDHSKDEVRTIVLSEEPKFRFKEKTIGSLSTRGMGSNTVEFKKRRLNTGAANRNIRKNNDDHDT